MQQCLTEADCRDMIQIEFSEEDIQQLNYERYHHPHPRVQKKMEVLYLKSRKLSHQEIRRLCQISKTTLVRYIRQYQQGGIEELKQLNYRGSPSQLNEQVQTIETYFQEHPPRKLTEAQAKIEELTGIKRNPTQSASFSPPNRYALSKGRLCAWQRVRP